MALLVSHVGKSDEALAVRVMGYPTTNAVPHVTVGICPGGKPVASNRIEAWDRVPELPLRGTVMQFKTYRMVPLEKAPARSSLLFS